MPFTQRINNGCNSYLSRKELWNNVDSTKTILHLAGWLNSIKRQQFLYQLPKEHTEQEMEIMYKLILVVYCFHFSCQHAKNIIQFNILAKMLKMMICLKRTF